MADLRVTVAGVDFSNPLIAASGTFGFGREYNEFYPLSTLGGISSKGITLKERLGNPPPRIAEAPGCMLNAILRYGRKIIRYQRRYAGNEYFLSKCKRRRRSIWYFLYRSRANYRSSTQTLYKTSYGKIVSQRNGYW